MCEKATYLLIIFYCLNKVPNQKVKKCTVGFSALSA